MSRINKQLQRDISLLLGNRIKNEAVKDVIITGVECSRDLERARVFFTALDPSRRPALLGELQNVKGALRTLLGDAIKLRRVPDLEFVPDESADYGARIDSILERLGLDSTEPEEPEEPESLDSWEADDA